MFQTALLVPAILFLAFPSWADESEFKIDPVLVKANGSFDSLSSGDFLPKKRLNFDSTRSTTLESLDRHSNFPSVNYGYPSGALGSFLGGRSLDDTQVSTLGVPLGLPQGGGPDLSFFPSFIWSGAQFSLVPTLAGFSPQGVSGSLELDLWTRTQVRDLKKSTNQSRVTFNADRNLQTVSIGSKVDSISILGGMNQGRQSGPAGSLSYYFIRKRDSHFIFHLLGSDQMGESPGDRLNPSPNARKKSWRIIPALESHQEWGDEDDLLILESTVFGDLHQLSYEDPGLYSTLTRSQQYGFENAVHWRQWTLAFSGRWVEFQSGNFGNYSEVPLLAHLSHRFNFDSGWNLTPSGGFNQLGSVGLLPTARISAEKRWNSSHRTYFQLNSLVKLPTLNARYYVLGSFQGNPNLKEERVHALISGHEWSWEEFKLVSTLKTEIRNQIQVNRNNTTENAGNARLISLEEEWQWILNSLYTMRAGVLFSHSRLLDRGISYPDLPGASGWLSSEISWGDHWRLIHEWKAMGSSTASGGEFHAGYHLMNLFMEWKPKDGFILTAGVDNLENKKAEVVLNYPLPGRMLFMNVSYQW